MAEWVTVTAKIPADLKKRLSKLEINLSGFVREALGTEAERLEREKLKKIADEAGKLLDRVPPEELIRSIRTGREAH